ncbi:MAG: radical SAM protein [Ignavibacteriaceae bacterium]
MKKLLTKDSVVNSCYFRTSVIPPYKKALIQITERCNLHCAHCFVSAGDYGSSMSLHNLENVLMPFFIDAKVISVTLTGGEPFVHPDILEIVSLFSKNNISVSICTNATLIEERQLKYLSKLNNVKINTSLDGFSAESHGKFRGNKDSFSLTINTIKSLSKYNLLNGFLVTPNTLANASEYVSLYEFAQKVRAKYVLINPCSRFGRGNKIQGKLNSPNEVMNKIRESINLFDKKTEVVYVRFPNETLPLAFCEAGNIFYIFTNGDIAICPYLVFAAKNMDSKHKPEEFIVGNIFTDTDINRKLLDFKFQKKYNFGNNIYCNNCEINDICGKGCPAAIISSGNIIEEVDSDICPKINSIK